MTGFGSADFRVDDATFQIEVRSVNQRHLDVRLRLPRPLAAYEPEIRARVQARFARGKVDLTITAPEGGTPSPRLLVDLDAAREYVRAAEQLRAETGIAGALEVDRLLSLPGVARFSEPELPEQQLRSALFGALDTSLSSLEAMRIQEGEALERELRSRLARVAEMADSLQGRADTVQEAARTRLRKRAAQLEREVGILDEARLHQEVVYAADRLDVTEEIVRLRSHVEQFRKILGDAQPGHAVGRRLDFLLQELGREANTIGSKGGDAPIAHSVVELKTELERLREQVQNVE